MSNQLATTENVSTAAAIFSPEGLMRLQQFAQIMAEGAATVPQHLRGKTADCLAVTMQAAQWGMNPFAVAQKTHIVNGTLGYEAQLVNAVVSSSSLLASRINYNWSGDWTKCSGKNDKSPDLTVTVSAVLRGEAEPRELTISMAQAGVRNSPLWEQDPKQQLAYLCTKRWARLHAPDVLLGVYTPDELDDTPRGERDITPRTTADLNNMIGSSGDNVQPADNIDDDVVVAGLQEEIELADSLEKAVAIGEKISQYKEALSESTFRSLRSRAGKVYKHHDARRQIEAAINSLDASAPDAKETFLKVEADLQRLKGQLGDDLHEGFSITLADMKAEYV
ncbi:RecT family recombinase [Pantoea ananatis]|uniref:RecT family recombinase n=1 Tax=Pantoea ananas TaxID=553 RepID=UPI001B306AF9|nr:RecT family recombinase [Pantoea ananatis]